MSFRGRTLFLLVRRVAFRRRRIVARPLERRPGGNEDARRALPARRPRPRILPAADEISTRAAQRRRGTGVRRRPKLEVRPRRGMLGPSGAEIPLPPDRRLRKRRRARPRSPASRLPRGAIRLRSDESRPAREAIALTKGACRLLAEQRCPGRGKDLGSTKRSRRRAGTSLHPRGTSLRSRKTNVRPRGTRLLGPRETPRTRRTSRQRGGRGRRRTQTSPRDEGTILRCARRSMGPAITSVPPARRSSRDEEATRHREGTSLRLRRTIPARREPSARRRGPRARRDGEGLRRSGTSVRRMDPSVLFHGTGPPKKVKRLVDWVVSVWLAKRTCL